jgi:hypothetical protein
VTWNGDAQAVREYQEASSAWATTASYKARLTGTAQGRTFEMILEWVKPNRTRISFSDPAPGAFIIIEGSQWTTSPSGGCARVPGNIRMPGPNVQTPDTPLDGTITVARAGTQTIDGVATNAYDVVIVSSRGQVKQKNYIDPRTKTFKRWEVEDAQGKITYDYLEFNTNIRIEPPC